MVVVFIGVGSNLGDREDNINKALVFLAAVSGIKIAALSSFSETEPQEAYGPDYINAVVKIETSLEPQKLLGVLQQIEQRLRRKRLFKDAPRTIDLDILLYADRAMNSRELIIPHPKMLERDFVMKPLLEIEPELKEKLKYVCKR